VLMGASPVTGGLKLVALTYGFMRWGHDDPVSH